MTTDAFDSYSRSLDTSRITVTPPTKQAVAGFTVPVWDEAMVSHVREWSEWLASQRTVFNNAEPQAKTRGQEVTEGVGVGHLAIGGYDYAVGINAEPLRKSIAAAIDAAIAEERERCAAVAESNDHHFEYLSSDFTVGWGRAGHKIAHDIRHPE
jgi:hypothetical protein